MMQSFDIFLDVIPEQMVNEVNRQAIYFQLNLIQNKRVSTIDNFDRYLQPVEMSHRTRHDCWNFVEYMRTPGTFYPCALLF